MMISAELIKLFQKANYVIISTDQLKELMRSSVTEIEKDTSFSGLIRILKFDHFHIFQEETPKGEIIIRKFNDRINAENLLNERLEIYENMWNGCGCKVDYYK